jgi:hypothetical protein
MHKPITLTDEEIEKLFSGTKWDREYDPYYINPDDWGYFELEETPKCKHEWYEDSYFSNNKYITCRKCQAKKEEVDK